MFEFLLPPKRRRKRRTAIGKTSAPEAVFLPEAGLEFILQRDTCRTLRLTVKPDGSVHAKAPEAVPREDILRFVRSRADWIRKKRDFFLAHRASSVEFKEGGTILFLGRPFRLSPLPARRGLLPRLTADRLELPCRSEEDIESAFKAWRLSMAKLILRRRLTRLETRGRAVFGDKAAASSLKVRSLKRRWGSCSVRGQVTLAAQLVELPLPLVDYVICHELCHLRHMDHSPAFHAALQKLLPDARTREKNIRIWSLEHPRT